MAGKIQKTIQKNLNDLINASIKNPEFGAIVAEKLRQDSMQALQLALGEKKIKLTPVHTKALEKDFAIAVILLLRAAQSINDIKKKHPKAFRLAKGELHKLLSSCAGNIALLGTPLVTYATFDPGNSSVQNCKQALSKFQRRLKEYIKKQLELFACIAEHAGETSAGNFIPVACGWLETEVKQAQANLNSAEAEIRQSCPFADWLF